MKIADIHAHIFPEKLAEKASHSIGSFYGVSIEREADMPRLCAEDKLAGITRCVVSNSATNASQVQNANTFLAEAVRGHDGYLAFGTIYPGMDGFEEELDRMLELGLRGIKIHPDFQKLAIDDERGIETYKAIARRDLPVLFHMGDDRYDFSSPERLTNLLRRVPELRAVAAHFGGWRSWTRSRRLRARFIQTNKQGRAHHAEASVKAAQLEKAVSVQCLQKYDLLQGKRSIIVRQRKLTLRFLRKKPEIAKRVEIALRQASAEQPRPACPVRAERVEILRAARKREFFAFSLRRQAHERKPRLRNAAEKERAVQHGQRRDGRKRLRQRGLLVFQMKHAGFRFC